VQALSKIWWLLALCGIVEAMSAAMHLLMMNPDGSLSLRRFALMDTAWAISMLSLVAGVIAIMVGLWNAGRGNSWLLSLHGLALGAFGLIGVSPLGRGPLSFRPISLLFLLMALSVGAFAWRTAQTLRSGSPDRWLLSVSGAASIGFAFSFIGVGFGWVRLGPPYAYWIWMGSYFGLCAVFMLYLALRLRGQGISQSGPSEVLPSIGSPRHAH
jgi:hypothetical protein